MTLVDLIDRILDKGLIINADITVAIGGVELLGIKIRAAIASFETAANYGLEFPSGTTFNRNALPKPAAHPRGFIDAAPKPVNLEPDSFVAIPPEKVTEEDAIQSMPEIGSNPINDENES